MNEGFIQSFKRFSFLKLSDLMILFKSASFKSFKKGEIIAREGDYFEYIFLVRTGIIKTHFLTENGEERTIKLATENQFTGCGNCFLKGEPSSEFLEAIEDTKVIAINIKKLQELSIENPRILRLIHEGVKENLIEAIERVEFFTTLTPAQRYKKLIEYSPELIKRVPLKYLASYIGVTRVSLSRIRNRNLN